MPQPADNYREQVRRDGFAVLRAVYSPREVEGLLDSWAAALNRAGAGAAIRGLEGTVYAARNVLTLWPEAARVWRRPPLAEALAELLGPAHGLVRGLFFDKPPEQTWALPWHKDLTIAVRDNRLPS